LIKKFVQAVKEIYRPGTKVVEIGGGLGYLTEKLAEEFDDIEVIEYDETLFEILKQKTCLPACAPRRAGRFAQKSNIKLIQGDILEYEPPKKPYLLVGNIPFHLSGRLYRKFMSDENHKPYGMVFITDKNYAETLMSQPPRCYRVSLQAQAYGDIGIVADAPPETVYPEPKVMSCIMKIRQNDLVLPENFWKTVNYHWENFPTPEVESPKTVGLKGWIKLAKKS
jgi:16S rRNA A1518/A1519 N6-dimethyltransferase RsmA/KsgA/DIM1 with predicted DNA glycosylase/AP lyase activity